MKYLLLTTAAILALTWTCTVRAEQPTAKTALQGTWKLIAEKNPGESEYTDFPEDLLKLKLITDTHWTWIQYPTSDKHVQAIMGGTYSLAGNTYTESIDYVGQAGEMGEWLKAALGSKNAFAIKVEGDKFHLAGRLMDGTEIDEIWQRVK